MKHPKYAVIPENTNMERVIGLTRGKKYEITEVTRHFKKVGWGFYIKLDFKLDFGEKIFCLEKKCCHLNNQEWELIYE